MSPTALDESVYPASKELRGRGAPDPDVLMLMATGVGLLPSSFRAQWQLPLESVAGVPRAWRGLTLSAAESNDATFWFLDDAAGEADFPGGEQVAPGPEPWMRAFPAWLAACSGATLCVHTSAGTPLGPSAAGNRGRIGLVSDHINLSGRTPLHGLGESRLGPLFPDQSQLHHPGLRRLALQHAERLGLRPLEGVAACTAGPALETPAERDYYHRAGADFAVQGLADPLIALAHSSLSCLSLVALIGAGDDAPDVAGIVEAATEVAPALEDLVRALAPDLAKVAFELREEL